MASDPYRRERWGAKLRGYVYWLVIVAVIGLFAWAIAAYTGIGADVIPGTDAAPGQTHESTAYPDTNGINKIELTEDTLRAHVDGTGDFSQYRLTAPDGEEYIIQLVGEEYVYRKNRPDGWPAGEYELTEIEQNYNLTPGYTEYNTERFQLTPSED